MLSACWSNVWFLVHRPTGILVFAEEDGESELQPTLLSLEKCGISYEVCKAGGEVCISAVLSVIS